MILHLHDNFFAHFRDKKGIQNIKSPNFLTEFTMKLVLNTFGIKQYKNKMDYLLNKYDKGRYALYSVRESLFFDSEVVKIIEFSSPPKILIPPYNKPNVKYLLA